MIATIFIFTFIIVLMVLLGIVFSLGKGSSLIAGFNTLPKEEKDTYDVVALCKFMGKMMFALSFSVMLWLLSEVYQISWLFFLGLALFIAIIILMILYVNTGNRFKKRGSD